MVGIESAVTLVTGGHKRQESEQMLTVKLETRMGDRAQQLREAMMQAVAHAEYMRALRQDAKGRKDRRVTVKGAVK